MKILIVEDDPRKLEVLSTYVQQSMPAAEVSERLSYNSGLREIIAQPYDCILLDMCMPTFDISGAGGGGDVKTFAGMEMLEEMERRGLPGRVIVVTQFENFGEGEDLKTLRELRDKLSSRFTRNYEDTIFYDPSHSDWREKLAKGLGDIERDA